MISFGLVGRRSFTEFVSRTGWIASLSPEFEVAGSSFAGRSFNVGGFSPRRASISVRSRDRDVSCVDFVSIIHPDYRPEPIRGARLLSSRDLGVGEGTTKGEVRDLANDRRPSLAPIFGTDRSTIGYPSFV